MNKPSEPALSVQNRLRRIEGRHNPLVKQLRQAFSRSELTDAGDCAIEGLRILEEAIRSGLRFSSVVYLKSAQDRANRLLPQIGAQVETLLLPDKLFDSLVPSESPQGVAALVRLKDFSLDDVLERLQVGPIVVLAGLQDPGNLGTILRSAEAFGSAGTILGEGTVSPFNSNACKSDPLSSSRACKTPETSAPSSAPPRPSAAPAPSSAKAPSVPSTRKSSAPPPDQSSAFPSCTVMGNQQQRSWTKFQKSCEPRACA